jgi:hypothetical protein
MLHTRPFPENPEFVLWSSGKMRGSRGKSVKSALGQTVEAVIIAGLAIVGVLYAAIVDLRTPNLRNSNWCEPTCRATKIQEHRVFARSKCCRAQLAHKGCKMSGDVCSPKHKTVMWNAACLQRACKIQNHPTICI